ncbi:MAG: hypothetical protein ACJAW3_000522 [Lentimonas sp.]
MGTAEAGKPAQGKLKDMHGRTHYVMLEPDFKNQSFKEGAEVLLVKRAGSIFYAIENTNSNLQSTTTLTFN